MLSYYVDGNSTNENAFKSCHIIKALKNTK